jgi:hypothetical protein
MGKQLASAGEQYSASPIVRLIRVDKRVRDNAIANLAAFLSRSNDPEGSSSAVLLTDSEMAKLWKGVFYCEAFNMKSVLLIQNRLLDVRQASCAARTCN